VTHNWLDEGLLGRVREIVRPWSCHVVGGAVRDRLLGRTARDLDLVVSGPGAQAALTAGLPAKAIELGGERFAAVRLVGEGFEVDLWDRGDESLRDELARRDLTVNAIAVDLGDGSWHDPLAGREDIRLRRLRAATGESFRDDPLRVLRLTRLAAELPGFSVDKATLALAAEAVDSLGATAPERQREELRRALIAPAPEVAVELWSRLRIYPQRLFPRADPSVAGDRALVLLRAGEDHAARLRVEPLTLRLALIAAAAQGDPDDLLEHGYITRREARDLALALSWDDLPDRVEDQRWLLHRSGELWPTGLCVAAALQPESAGVAVTDRVSQILRLMETEGNAILDPKPFLRGDEIRELLGVTGAALGIAARQLRRAQVEGRICDRDQAVDWLVNERR